jgi:ABC-2 type transport system permease protein
MLRGLWELTWLETKIFVREPLGVIGTVAIPVVTFIVLGRLFAGRSDQMSARTSGLVGVEMPVLAAMLICLSAVLSLVTIVAIYREGGILKRLRATPLRPHTILTAQVLVKLLFTLITMAALLLAGKRYYPVRVDVPVVSFALALIVSTVAILAMGFLIASLVPTARFAQPVGTLIFYPMIALSGLFMPIASFPPALRVLARLLPLTYVASLLKGIWQGEPWSAHGGDLAALVAVFAICIALSAKVFRWE